MRNLRILGLLVPLTALALGPGISQVSAAGPGGGILAFSIVAPLPTYPCTAGGCPGTAQGSAPLAAASGVDGVNPWEYVATNNNSNAAYSSFTYNEPGAFCAPQGGAVGFPVIGGANGQTTSAAGTGPDPVLAANGGGYGAAGGTFRGTYKGAAVSGVATTASFKYQRVGTVAVLLFSGVGTSLYDANGNDIHDVVVNGTGAAAAIFQTATLPNCSGNPISVTVTGVATLA